MGTQGLASCTTCGDGTEDEDGYKCVSCASGRAGVGGVCNACPSGKEPDILQRECVNVQQANGDSGAIEGSQTNAVNVKTESSSTVTQEPEPNLVSGATSLYLTT